MTEYWNKCKNLIAQVSKFYVIIKISQCLRRKDLMYIMSSLVDQESCKLQKCLSSNLEERMFGICEKINRLISERVNTCIFKLFLLHELDTGSLKPWLRLVHSLVRLVFLELAKTMTGVRHSLSLFYYFWVM